MKLPSASKLPSGRWRIQVQVDGDRLSITADTKKECERKAAALKMGLERPQSRSKLLLRDAVENYISAKESVLSPSTIAGYRYTAKNRFQSVMNIEIYKLTNQDLQIAVAEDARQVSAKTVKNAYSLIHAALEYYHVHVDDVTLPQVMRHNVERLQLDEIKLLIDACHGDLCEIPILMGLLMGMRRSEILGLCWDCVDLNAGTLTIRRAWIQNTLRDVTKNKTSQRVLDIDPMVMPLLEPSEPSERVCPLAPATLDRHIKRLCLAAGVTVTTFHGLRHTWAAFMASLGVDSRVIIKEGGWSSTYTLQAVYDYVFDAERKQVTERKSAYFAHEMHTKNSRG